MEDGMVIIEVGYDGDLRCSATHGPSGSTLATDAPVDNHGRGERFSPTDLVATALGTCILTTMGIVAERHEFDLRGATVRVTKEMTSQPVRRIARLGVTITMPQPAPEAMRRRLETAALRCPVKQSLHPDVEAPVTWQWTNEG
jgi:putative redox protein